MNEKKTKISNEFNSRTRVGKRKTARPFNPLLGMHLVLKLNDKLPYLFNPKNKLLRTVFERTAKGFGITIYQLVLNSTHVHIYMRAKSRADYVRFIRALTSKLVAYFSKSLKKKLTKIFKGLPFTRMITWGREVGILLNYFIKNERESGVKQVVEMPQRKKEKLSSKND